MKSSVTRLAVVAVLGLLAAAATAQTENRPTDRNERRALAYAELVAELDREPLPTFARRQKLLLDFLAEHEVDKDCEEVLSARLRLGTLALQRLDRLTAKETLTDVAERAGSLAPELRARALFGLHQAHLLAQDEVQAREVLATILREHEDDAPAQGAKIALEHLEQRQTLEVGKRMPRLAFGPDLAERSVDERTFAPGARIYVFWSIAHEPSQRRLEAVARVWRRLGLPEANVIAYAADDDTGALRRLAQQRKWTFRVVPAGSSGFLHPDWIRLDVRAVPTTLLVGADDVLLAVDLSPARLEDVLRGN